MYPSAVLTCLASVLGRAVLADTVRCTLFLSACVRSSAGDLNVFSSEGIAPWSPILNRPLLTIVPSTLNNCFLPSAVDSAVLTGPLNLFNFSFTSMAACANPHSVRLVLSRGNLTPLKASCNVFACLSDGEITTFSVRAFRNSCRIHPSHFFHTLPCFFAICVSRARISKLR